MSSRLIKSASEPSAKRARHEDVSLAFAGKLITSSPLSIGVLHSQGNATLDTPTALPHLPPTFTPLVVAGTWPSQGGDLDMHFDGSLGALVDMPSHPTPTSSPVVPITSVPTTTYNFQDSEFIGKLLNLKTVDSPVLLAPHQPEINMGVLALNPAMKIVTPSNSSSGGSSLSDHHPRDMLDFVKRQNSHGSSTEQCFQYILMAPTSAAVRLHEEPLTYLNQGQSYEIRFKKLGPGAPLGKCYKSVVRVRFHDRRQKFQEKELLLQWRSMHANEKLIDVDLPMSYGLHNVKVAPYGNTLEFQWDPTKQTSAFVKLNCISTEFTAHKHGGEKGVPFRICVDTYLVVDNVEPKRLHSAYSQVKVFKTKGADRKNKTDRDKAEKRGDKEKYQPAYDYTILTETFPTDFYQYESQQSVDLSEDTDSGSSESMEPNGDFKPDAVVLQKLACRMTTPSDADIGGNQSPNSDVLNRLTEEFESRSVGTPNPPHMLTTGASPREVSDWLKKHRFHAYAKQFGDYSGADLLRLSKEDLVQLCGLADGLRLHNALQVKKIEPKLTLYLCEQGAPAYHAVFLTSLTGSELVRKIAELMHVDSNRLRDLYCQGPGGINILLTDEVVQNMTDRSQYILEMLRSAEDMDDDRFRILLKSV